MAESHDSQEISPSPMQSSIAPPNCVLVCHNKTCRKQGAPEVLKAFQSSHLSEVKIINCGCLGKCGNGPMVLVMPIEAWYSRVSPEMVHCIIAQQFDTND